MNDFFRADLHCHSTSSDGTLTPKEIIQLALQKNLNGLSITDHDTIENYDEALQFAKEKNLPLISGVELSAEHRNKSVHILAYGFPIDALPLKKFCQKHHERRKNRLKNILEKLNHHGIQLSWNDVTHTNSDDFHHSIGRPHLAMAMMKKGYVSSIQEAFQKFLGEKGLCFVPGEAFSVEETLDVIHQSQGLAVIAHPHLINDTSIVQDLLAMNFDGIEGYYARFSKSEQDRWVKIGMKKGWLITGGSDFHGDVKPNSSLGSSWVNEETFSILYQHFQQSSHNKI